MLQTSKQKMFIKKIFSHWRQTDQGFVKFNEKIINNQQQKKQNKEEIIQNKSDFAKKNNDEII